MSRNTLSVLLITITLVSQLVPSGSAFAYDIQPEFVMFRDPEFDVPADIKQLDERLLPLWRQVLLRPEADYQSQAAEAITHAVESGFPGMEVAQEDLHTLLTTAEHPAARCAAARALIAIDARSSAEALFEASQKYDSPLRLIIEPALADWEFAPIREVWRDRVRNAGTNRIELVLALDGLAQAQDAEALDAMLEIVHSGDRPPSIRIVAARAAGAAAESGLESNVDRLLGLESPGVVHRLCAVALLSRHANEAAINQLTLLAHDAEPTVVEQALGRLNEIDPELVIPLAEEARLSLDPKVRRRVADTYVALATPERVAYLSEMLNDLHPDVRGSIREDLFTLASREDLSDAVREEALAILGGDIWRGQEQAALLLGALDYEPAAGRMVELLRAERAEVMIATAWGLKKLAVPETCPEMLAHARHQSTERRAGRSIPGLDEQVAHIFEAFALMHYEPSEELLREYVPKIKINGNYSRGAAIWTLGHFYAGHSNEDLAAQFTERMNDTMDITNQEAELVWRMSAISLGRMQSVSQLQALRDRLPIAYDRDLVAYAIRWSILQITGEEIPGPPPLVVGQTGWFLEPYSDQTPAAAQP